MSYPVHSIGVVKLGKLSHSLIAVVLHKARAHTKVVPSVDCKWRAP